ncbi:MAG: hypothetical protein IPI67_07785 [Myxococcales bacterium]|nr:hypothetical protein [Myxococcales bacterium]
MAVGVGCDTKLVNFQLAGSSHQVHEVRSDYTWHKGQPVPRAAARRRWEGRPRERVRRPALPADAVPAVESQCPLLQAGKTDYLKLNHVVNGKEKLDLSKFNRLVYWNEKHIAYDSMSQVDFGLRMLRFTACS